MFQDTLDLKERDVQVLQLVMADPSISQSEIAKKLKLSQPSINSRLKKLRERGIITHQVGIAVTKAKLFLARVDFTCKDANKIMEGLRGCPYFVNGFVMSGKHNASVFLISEDMKRIDQIVNDELRIHQSVSDVSVNLVVSTVNDVLFRPHFGPQTRKLCNKVTQCEVCLH